MPDDRSGGIKSCGRKIKSEEIAEKAGVSRSTVSKVINNYGDVGEETKKRVLKVIKEFGYSPNIAARILAGKGVETIGLFFLLQRDEAYDLANDSIVDQMMAVVIDAAARLGFLTLTVIIRNIDDRSEAQIRDIFTQGRIDAGIFLGGRSREPVIEELVEQGFLVGIVDYPKPAKQEPNRIIVNYDPRTGEKAAEYLISLGHREIMGVQGDLFRFDGNRKYKGFMSRLKDLGIVLPAEWDIRSSFYLGDSRSAMDKFIESGAKLPTAVFCANDHIAYGVMLSLKSKGIRVPEDVSVIGVDDAILSQYMHPPLTSFQVDFNAMLSRLTAALIEAIAEMPQVPVYLEFENSLIERESARRIESV